MKWFETKIKCSDCSIKNFIRYNKLSLLTHYSNYKTCWYFDESAKKIQIVYTQKCLTLKMVDQCYHENVLYEVVKDQDLWMNKKKNTIWWLRHHLGLKKPLNKIPFLGKILF